MMKIIPFLAIFFPVLIFSQEQPIQTTQLNELLITEKNGRATIDAEKPATFPLGVTVLRNKIAKNFRMRKVHSNAETESCSITFLIDKEGFVTEVKAYGDNESFNREAERALLKIKDKWTPAELNGEKVRYRFRIPLTISFNQK